MHWLRDIGLATVTDIYPRKKRPFRVRLRRLLWFLVICYFVFVVIQLCWMLF